MMPVPTIVSTSVTPDCRWVRLLEIWKPSVLRSLRLRVVTQALGVRHVRSIDIVVQAIERNRVFKAECRF
jgi:hypothetical protein